MKIILKYSTIFLTGGILYMLLEIAFRGNTHWTMGILGGICFICIGIVNNSFGFSLPIQMVLDALIITLLELISGIILNMGLHWNIWDYSQLPFNILGQVCLPFSLLWFCLSLPAIYLNKWICLTFFK